MGEQPAELAWLVLSAANRAQAKGSTVRLIMPRAPEVAETLGMDLTDAQLLSAEEYLQDQGYITPAGLGLTWGAYTITSAGREWLGGDLSDEEVALVSALWAELSEAPPRGGLRELRELPRRATEEPIEPTPSASIERPQEPAKHAQEQRRRFWSRLFGA